MELMKAIEQRRSIRKYKPKEVEDKKIETILEALGGTLWMFSLKNTKRKRET